MSLINKMNVGNTNYDIQDRLMPDVIGQAGQVLRVKDDASGLEFSDTEAGGGNVYMHLLEFDGESSTANPYYLYFYSTFNTSITYDNINEYSTQIPFGVLCYIDADGQFIFDGIITTIQLGSPGKIILSQPGTGIKRMLKLNSDTVTEV